MVRLPVGPDEICQSSSFLPSALWGVAVTGTVISYQIRRGIYALTLENYLRKY
jgi:hypothetical protein